MKHANRKNGAVVLGFLAIAGLAVGCFLAGVEGVSRGHRQEEKQRIEDALRRNAVACYASEGFYPPDVEYMIAHYGIQIDESRYTVRYVPVAQNLMPDITVLEK